MRLLALFIALSERYKVGYRHLYNFVDNLDERSREWLYRAARGTEWEDGVIDVLAMVHEDRYFARLGL